MKPSRYLRDDGMYYFNILEKRIFEDVIHDAKMEISLNNNKDVDLLVSPYITRMKGVIRELNLQSIMGIKFVDDCDVIVNTRYTSMRDELSRFARSIA